MVDEPRRQSTERTSKGGKSPVPKREDSFSHRKNAGRPDALKKLASAQHRGKGSRRMPVKRSKGKRG